ANPAKYETTFDNRRRCRKDSRMRRAHLFLLFRSPAGIARYFLAWRYESRSEYLIDQFPSQTQSLPRRDQPLLSKIFRDAFFSSHPKGRRDREHFYNRVYSVPLKFQ